MNFEDFDLGQISGGTSITQYLSMPGSGQQVDLPVLVTCGTQPGPTIAVIGGVHGDEYEGPHAIRTLFSTLDAASLSGTFVGVPQANPPAFSTGTRSSPLDGLNLARVFPGNIHGKPTERIAYYLGESIIGKCDFMIDLHSSGTLWEMPLLIGCDDRDNTASQHSREAALAFGLPTVWRHNDISPGRTVTEATNRGIPWLYAECPGGGWLHIENSTQYVQGVRNVMTYLRMLPGHIPPRIPQYSLYGSGDVDSAQASKTTGFLVRQVALLERVRKGDVLGTVFGLAGETLEEIRANTQGVVVFMRAVPSITTGDLAFMLAFESP